MMICPTSKALLDLEYSLYKGSQDWNLWNKVFDEIEARGLREVVIYDNEEDED